MKARPGAVGYVGVINLLKKLWLWLWLMCLCLMIGQAGLAESVVDEAALNPAPQVQALAPYWLELDKAVGEGCKASVQVTADLREWNPFETETTASINQLLKHCALNVEYLVFGNEPQFAVDIRVDDQSAVSYVQKQTAEGTEWLTDLTDTVYVQHGGEPLLPFMAAEADETAFSWEEVLLSDATPENVLYSMINQIKPLGSPKSANRKLAQIGTAKKVIKVTLKPEETMNLITEAFSQWNSPLAETILPNIQLTGSEYVFSVYQSKDGKDFSLIVTGRAAYGEGDARKVTLNWRFKEQDGSRLDLISFKAPAVKGKNDLTVKIDWQRTWNAEQHSSKLTGSVSSVVNKDKSSLKVKADLNNALSDNAQHVTGTVTLEETPDDVTYTTVYAPDFVLTNDGEYSVEGTLAIKENRGKNALLDAVLSIGIQTDDGLLQEPAGLANRLVLDDMSEDERDTAVNELSIAMAGRLLKALMALPAEERQVLMLGISEENQTLVEEAFQALQP